MALPKYNPKNIQKISIDKVKPNDYNPKQKDTKEYHNVVKSLQENGLQQPIMVREKDGEYIIVDGEQRYTAAKELGFTEVYIYNFGEISDLDAKATTIWMEVQVPFDQIELAPIVLELDRAEFVVPFSEKELEDFGHLAEFDFEKAWADSEPLKTDDGKEKTYTLKINLTKDQLDEINDAIKSMVKNENIGEARALELLVSMGYESYQSTNYTPENTDINEI